MSVLWRARDRWERLAVATLDRIPVWPALVALSAAVVVGHLVGTHGTAWHWFHDAARLLLGDTDPGEAGGLGLYRDHPGFQFGPVSIVASVPFALMGHDAGAVAAMVVSTALGLVAFGAIASAVRHWYPHLDVVKWRRAQLVGGAAFVLTWGDVASRTVHLDDAVALAATAGAVWGCARNRGWWRVAVLVALAAAAKPWAVAFAPLVAVPAVGPRAVVRVAVVGVLVGLTWAPFVLAEPATLDAARHGIENDATSVLRALGVNDPLTPGWARPAQLVGGFALAALVVARGAWPAALLAGVAWRLLLEPGANRYYTVGLVLAALVLHMWQRPERVPVAVIAAAVVLEVTAIPTFPAVAGSYLRLGVVAAGLAAVGWAAVRPGSGAPTAPLPAPAPGPTLGRARSGSRSSPSGG